MSYENETYADIRNSITAGMCKISQYEEQCDNFYADLIGKIESTGIKTKETCRFANYHLSIPSDVPHLPAIKEYIDSLNTNIRSYTNPKTGEFNIDMPLLLTANGQPIQYSELKPFSARQETNVSGKTQSVQVSRVLNSDSLQQTLSQTSQPLRPKQQLSNTLLKRASIDR